MVDDDTALLAGNEEELTELTSKINEVGKQLCCLVQQPCKSIFDKFAF